MTLRTRLTLAAMAVVVAATAVLGAVVATRTESTLVAQVDDRLRVSVDRLGGGPGGRAGPDGGRLGPLRGTQPATQPGADAGSDAGADDRYRDTAELLVSRRGDMVVLARAGFPDDPAPLPDLDGVEVAHLTGEIRTVAATEGDLRYRVLAHRIGGRTDAHRVLAASLADVDSAVDDLLRTLLVTAVVVVAAAGALSWWVIRRGFRPVDRMIATAGAIAAGDLSQRVDHRDDGTELGRLAAALDDMLAQLEAAFSAREESQARLRRFVSDASHELRTPVSSIRGYAELYRQGGLGDEADLERAMARIETESTRMGALVGDLLLLARLDQSQPLVHEPVDLTAVVADAAADVEAMEPDRPVSVEVTPGVVVPGDEGRLRQVAANLVANALAHTPPATPVAVRLGVDARAGQAVLEVADQGPGIAAEHLPRLFERFYRADPSRSRATGGAGLGLSIVAAVAEAHGGTVTVDSEPGRGATFTVRLPLAPPASR